MAHLAPKEEVEDFLDKVDEISLLIEGLKEGTISPEYVDTKVSRDKKLSAIVANEPNDIVVRDGKSTETKGVSRAKENVQSKEEKEKEERRVRERQEKLEELKANYLRKKKAREKFAEYARTNKTQTTATDYTKWDLWCPTDEEDDMINSCTPNSAEFRAMEKDIDERHRRMVERRQIAERRRVEGNNAFKNKQFSEALRCYEEGIEAEKTNITLHSNAAMAALKLKCFVQAIEHCDKAIKVIEFFESNKQSDVAVKVYQRRATAYQALSQFKQAVDDLEAALKLEPANAEVKKQLATSKQMAEEQAKAAKIKKMVSKGVADQESSLDVEKLKQLEKQVQSLATQTGAVEASQMTDEQVQEVLVQLCRILSLHAVPEAILGNTATCLSQVADVRELLPELAKLDPVAVLVGVAYAGKGNSASKNAAVALAKLAHEPTMLERLRELHGIEIIYQYVKP